MISAMRSGAVSKPLGAVLQGEALFNDRVGFVAFSAALDRAVTDTAKAKQIVNFRDQKAREAAELKDGVYVLPPRSSKPPKATDER